MDLMHQAKRCMLVRAAVRDRDSVTGRFPLPDERRWQAISDAAAMLTKPGDDAKLDSASRWLKQPLVVRAVRPRTRIPP